MDEKFIPYLYSQSTIPSMIKHYCIPMLTDSNILTRMKASKLFEYRAGLLDNEFKKNLKKVFGDIYEELINAYPHHSLLFELFGRIKSLFSTINKLEELEASTLEKLHYKLVSQMLRAELQSINDEEAQNAFLKEKISEMQQNEQYLHEFQKHLTDKKFIGENPFERVHDFFAFRIVIEDMKADELIVELYKIANMVIEHFIKAGYEVINQYPLLETGEILQNELIVVPSHSYLNPKYKKMIKDYVQYPKKSGYQGIHIVINDPISGRDFEVQIRTRSMDIIANSIAAHKKHKAQKYGKQQEQEKNVDFKRINVRGFRVFQYEEGGETKSYMSDTAGIKEAVTFIYEKHGY